MLFVTIVTGAQKVLETKTATYDGAFLLLTRIGYPETRVF